MLIKKRSSLWFKIKIALLLAVLVGGSIYLVFYSPIFKITAVNIAIADFDSSKLAGLIGPDPRGENIIFWSPVSQNLEYPEIKDIKISKNYFKRTIEVSGTVRNKASVWCFESGEKEPALRSLGEVGCFWTDETGYIFAEAPNIEGGALTVINDNRSMSLSIGETVLPASMFNNLNLILTTLAELKLPIENIIVEDLSRREFVVNIENGPKMTFSLEASPAFVKPALTSIIKSSAWSRTKTVNLTVEGRVYQGF